MIVERLSRDLSLRPRIIWFDVMAIFPAIIQPRTIASYARATTFPEIPSEANTRDNKQFHDKITSELVSNEWIWKWIVVRTMIM